ncbi:CAMK family protein kinase [Histomonas meleagridis]|uniref:CAMK family protein kinase n=1 Tax=Histomonas meleagridis TaxID=135588 RepID=UPI00355A6676|nr:CAMK family protein kinase [Histomonas meleagridis]KAH0797590.1 CAMK family protein kinase [Histomonas meleagridis]
MMNPLPSLGENSRQEDTNQEGSEWEMFQDVVHPMSIDEINERYKSIGILSQTRNSTVRLSIHNKTGEKVVMKIINKSTVDDAKKRLLLYREIRTLQVLGDQKHITELYEVIDSGDRIWVVMEYAAGGELFDFVKAKAPLVESDAREIFRPIVRVVAYMHSVHLVHRDLKLENILLDSNGRLMIADFGFSRFYEPANGLIDSICGTPQYSPPEIIQGQLHNPIYADSWCLGIILFMLFFGRFPFTGVSIPDLLQSIVKADYTFPFQISESATDLLHHLITLDPGDRYTASEIMKTKWYNKNRLPHPPKPVHKERIHVAVLRDMGCQQDISMNELDKLSDDDLVTYRIIHRRYQIGIAQLPPLTGLPHLDMSNRVGRLDTRRSHNSISDQKKETAQPRAKTPFGMDSATCKERIPNADPYIIVKKMKVSPAQRIQQRKSISSRTNLYSNNNKNKNNISRMNIRNLQTMRFRSITNEEKTLPQFNCKHTTLDSPKVLWEKLFKFLEREKNISILSEQNFCLYLLVKDQNELYVSLNIGCVHPGFGLIGFSLYKIKGNDNEFKEFENKVTEYFGF